MRDSVTILFCIAHLTLFGQRYPIPANGAAWDNTVANHYNTPIPLEITERFEYIGDTVTIPTIMSK